MAKKITLMCNGKKLEFNPLISDDDEGDSTKNPDVQGPGQGVFELSDLVLSANEVEVGNAVSCKTSIKGKNISQVSYELMVQVNNYAIGPVQRHFLRSPKEREVKGVVHPRWPEENEIEFEFRLAGRLLFCGEGFTLACMTPERYGVEPDAQIWSLEGVYQRGGGEPFRVKLEFDSQGALVKKTGFWPASVGGVVSPFELLIEDGDTFEPYVTMINEKGEIITGLVNPIMLGGGNQLRWEQVEACPGNYLACVVIEDFDGKKTRINSEIIIKA